MTKIARRRLIKSQGAERDLARENTDTEDSLLGIELFTEVYSGKLEHAREVFQRLADLLKRTGDHGGRTVFYTSWRF